MMRINHTMPLLWATLSLFLISGSSFAQGKSDDAKSRNYGVGQPKTVEELPYGQLRKQLESLPPQARGKALGWLQGFSFPQEDVKNLRANKHGDIKYADTILPPAVSGATEKIANTADATMAMSIDVFQLHSRPGSSNVLFLDFDGHTMVNTAWYDGTLTALPYDPSGNDSPATVANFTTSEMARIHEIWHRISEDFAAFDIDVTTEEPAVFTSTTGHVLFTHDTDANGTPMPAQNAGGVAWVNVFGRSDYATKYSPALVYYTNLGSGYAPYNAEAGSHEFGHNIGLSHDGVLEGSTYYSGHGSGMVDWSPIMGNSYQRNVTQWSRGEYADANNTQDDVSLIAGDLGFAGDDHGDSPGTATPLTVESNGDILVSSPELDPDNILYQNKGVIDDRSDVDWFYVDVTEAGALNISATPAWHSFIRSDYRGANLDIELIVMDSNLNIQAYDESDSVTNAQVEITAKPGRYYVQIDGVGNDTLSNYSDYASMGMFFIEGNVDSGGTQADTQPPSPATMSWTISPTASGTSSISMTAVQASDESGTVEYLFTCVAGGNGCSDSGWQSSRSFDATGLDSDTYYAFKVRARDAFGNENSNSPTMGDTTDQVPVEPPPAVNVAPVAVASSSPDPAVFSKGNSMKVTLDGSGSYDPDGQISSWAWKDAGGTTISSSSTTQANLRAGTYTFTLTVTDNNGESDTVSISVTVNKGSADDGGDGGDSGNPGKGGGKGSKKG